MEIAINLPVEKSPEDICLATSDDAQNMVAQGCHPKVVHCKIKVSI
jgi:hypothetical protein